MNSENGYQDSDSSQSFCIHRFVREREARYASLNEDNSLDSVQQSQGVRLDLMSHDIEALFANPIIKVI